MKDLTTDNDSAEALATILQCIYANLSPILIDECWVDDILLYWRIDKLQTCLLSVVCCLYIDILSVVCAVFSKEMDVVLCAIMS